MTERNVKGVDLAGSVRALKVWRKANDNVPIPGLHPDDAPYFEHLRVLSGGWYPLESFLRLLHLTHQLVLDGTPEAMEQIGRAVLVGYSTLQGALIKDGDPRGTLEGFQLGWSRHFDFSAVEVTTEPGRGWITIRNYDDIDELHATLHVGFFNALLESVGAQDVRCELLTKPWRTGEPAKFCCEWRGVIQPSG